MMRNKLLLIFFLILPLTHIHADEFIIKNFEKKSNDLAARRYEVTNTNDQACALIKIKTDLKGLQFESNLGISEIKHKTGEYWVYISPKEQRIKLIKEGFVPRNFYIPDEYQVESHDVFHLVVTTNVKYPITINRNPEDAKVYLDGKLKIDTASKSTISNVSFGRHSIKLKKIGYSTIRDTIFVKKDHFEFNYELEELEKVTVYIKSAPSHAQILIDKTNRGYTNNRFFIYPGRHELMLIKDHYKTIDRHIKVTKEGDNEFNYNLKYYMGRVHIKTNVKNPTILVDGRKLHSPTKDTLLSAERHKITVKKNKYYEQTKWITPLRDERMTQFFQLKPKTGDLYTNVFPETAKVELYNYSGKKLLDSWQGSRIKKDLQVGYYTLRVHQKNYKTWEETFVIKENQQKDLQVELSAFTLKPGTKANSIIWSFFLPGAGQWYSHDTGRGWLYFLSGLASVGSSIYCHMEVDQLSQDYQSIKRDYRTSEDPQVIAETRIESQQIYDQIEQYQDYREISYIAAGAVYALSLLDAIIFGGRKVTEHELSGKNNDQQVQVGLSNQQPGSMGVKVTVPIGR